MAGSDRAFKLGLGLLVGSHAMWLWVQNQEHMVSKEEDARGNPFRAVSHYIIIVKLRKM